MAHSLKGGCHGDRNWRLHKLHALAHEKDFCHQPTEGEKPHWQWKPGQSGNPAGRPKGSKNRGSILSQEIFDEKAAQLVVKAIEEALAGDRSLLRAAFVRAIPTPRARPLEIDIPEGASPEELEKVLDECQRTLKAGEITAEEAVGVANFVRARQEARARALDLQERELRVKLLERRLAAEEAEAKAAETVPELQKQSPASDDKSARRPCISPVKAVARRPHALPPAPPAEAGEGEGRETVFRL